jgi:N-ethylmaleimide reductase
MSIDILFTPLRLGALSLPNRIVMPALTRMRAGPGAVPTALNAEYYGQRASAGMIITEATAISVKGHGYPQMPGIHTPEQIAGWRLVTDAVHGKGGRIVLQIVHHGRWSHSSYNPDGSLPVAPSAIAPPGKAYTPTFEQLPYETPRALETAELPGIVAAFRQAALNGRKAGFDAVEIHGANGFLLDQFLQDGSNRRTDAYGGSIENRARLLLEVVDGIAEDIGSDRVAVRLSPHGNLGGLTDSDTVPHFSYVIGELSKRNLAYLHLIEPRASSAGIADNASIDSADNASLFRHLFDGPMISAGGYTPETAAVAVAHGLADAVALGRMFIANPDLPERIRMGAALNVFDRSTSYAGDAHGYTDYSAIPAAGTPPNLPGHAWTEIIKRPTKEGFAAAFSEDVALDTSIANRPIIGASDIRHFFDASRTMYDTLHFTHETSTGSRTCLEWEGKFRGADIAGTTILAFDPSGVIDGIQLYHRPYTQLVAYSAELGRRLKGKIDPSIIPE